jgi:hypothetical protein
LQFLQVFRQNVRTLVKLICTSKSKEAREGCVYGDDFENNNNQSMGVIFTEREMGDTL